MYFKDKKDYEQYLNKNEIQNRDHILTNFNNIFFQWSKEGDVLLEPNKCQKSTKNVEKYASCIGWILLNDGKTMALLKNSFGDIYRDLSLEDYNLALYNNILIPKIAKQLQNESASYYFTKIAEVERNQKNNRRYLLTLDFKGKDEELISGNDILGEFDYPTDILDIHKILEILEDYLIEKGFYTQDIQRIKIDFIKQSFFNKFIQQLDEHNDNWGILASYKNHSVRIAPVYDLDCSCGINKKSKKQRLCKDGSFSIKSFIKEFGNEAWFNQYIQEVIQNFDIHQAFAEAKEDTNVEIPKAYCEKYITFFHQRMQEVKDAYHTIDAEKKETDELEIT